HLAVRLERFLVAIQLEQCGAARIMRRDAARIQLRRLRAQVERFLPALTADAVVAERHQVELAHVRLERLHHLLRTLLRRLELEWRYLERIDTTLDRMERRGHLPRRLIERAAQHELRDVRRRRELTPLNARHLAFLETVLLQRVLDI